MKNYNTAKTMDLLGNDKNKAINQSKFVKQVSNLTPSKRIICIHHYCHLFFFDVDVDPRANANFLFYYNYKL